MTRSRRFGVALVALLSLAGGACERRATREAKQAPPPPATEGSAAPAAAADPPADPPADPWVKPAPKKDPLARPLLWSGEKDGITSYFLGTMHLGVDAEARLPELVWNHLDAARAFAMESDTNDPKLVAAMTTRASGTLRDDLGPAYWKKLEDALGAATARGLERVKPMVPASMLALKGLPATPPMDGVLLGRATNQKKPIVYLEDAGHAAKILEEYMDARALKMMLDHLDKGEAQTKEMLAAYTSGDEARIVAMADAQRADALAFGYTEAEYAASMEKILYQRNADWIAPIERLHAEGGGFIAVGAMHLVGPRSVLEMLGQRGWKIVRITP